nr:MAG TPA: hypothetical protein [Caudoviricetes sp.]
MFIFQKCQNFKIGFDRVELMCEDIFLIHLIIVEQYQHYHLEVLILHI